MIGYAAVAIENTLHVAFNALASSLCDRAFSAPEPTRKQRQRLHLPPHSSAENSHLEGAPEDLAQIVRGVIRAFLQPAAAEFRQKSSSSSPPDLFVLARRTEVSSTARDKLDPRTTATMSAVYGGCRSPELQVAISGRSRRMRNGATPLG